MFLNCFKPLELLTFRFLKVLTEISSLEAFLKNGVIRRALFGLSIP